jgi:hypothetical protein
LTGAVVDFGRWKRSPDNSTSLPALRGRGSTLVAL